NDNVVAVVNNEVITQNDLNEFINFMRIQLSVQYSQEEVEQRISKMPADLINRLIDDRLILQAAYKENINVDSNRIKARVEQIKKQYPQESDLQNALRSQGITLGDIELRIKEQFLMFEIINKEVRSNALVRPQDVTAYYNAHKEEFYHPELRNVKFLTVKGIDNVIPADSLNSQYKSLEEIADNYSLEITKLGLVSSKQLRKEIADIVFNLEVNKISSLLTLGENNYLFEVKEIKPPEKMSLQEVQEEISRFLFETKMQELMVEWMEKLRSQAYIEVKEAASRE
ncbi:MAG: peptidyl-prolyl cis-trans isomerase, partial [Candidatus Omnitrophota bacterium]